MKPRRSSIAALAATLLMLALVAVAQANVRSPGGAATRSMKANGNSGKVTDQYLIELQDGVIVDDFIREKGHGVGNAKGHTLKSIFRRTGNGYSIKFNNNNDKSVEKELDDLRADPRVKVIEQDSYLSLNGSRAVNTWGLDRIDQARGPLDGWFRSDLTGAGVAVYLVDTGVRSSNVQFGGRVRSGYSPDGSTDDCLGHGTHVAGTIAGATLGVAPGATIVATRAVDCQGSGTVTDALDALEWIIGDHQPGSPAVLNMSLGAPQSSVFNQAIADVAFDGIVPVVAAGNSGGDACTESPGASPYAITVGAVSVNDQRTSFSNFGSCVKIFAPGDGILSAGIASPTSTQSESGTSMAAPHVSGAVALLLQQQPGSSVSNVTQRLLAMATSGVVLDPGGGSPNRLLRIPATITAADSGKGAGGTPVKGAAGNGGSSFTTLATLARPRIIKVLHVGDNLTFWFTGPKNVKFELFCNGKLLAETRKRKLTVKHRKNQSRAVFTLRAYSATSKSAFSNKLVWQSVDHWLTPVN